MKNLGKYTKIIQKANVKVFKNYPNTDLRFKVREEHKHNPFTIIP